MRNVFFVLVCSLLILGCAQKVKVNYTQLSANLEIGMSQEEVIEIMGAPKLTSGYHDKEHWYYWNPTDEDEQNIVYSEILSTDKLSVKFTRGKLSQWNFNSRFDDILGAE